MRARLLSIPVFVLCAFSTVAFARTWTDNTGKYAVEAELVEVRDGNVHLRKTDGSVVSVPLERLSAADRRYLNLLPGMEGPSKPASPTSERPAVPVVVAQEPRIGIPQSEPMADPGDDLTLETVMKYLEHQALRCKKSPRGTHALFLPHQLAAIRASGRPHDRHRL